MSVICSFCVYREIIRLSIRYGSCSCTMCCKFHIKAELRLYLPNMRLLLLKDTPLIFLAVVVGRLHKLNFIACRERTWFVTFVVWWLSIPASILYVVCSSCHFYNSAVGTNHSPERMCISYWICKAGLCTSTPKYITYS